MTINLADFLNKEVTVTLCNGKTYTGIIKDSWAVTPNDNYPYYMENYSNVGKCCLHQQLRYPEYGILKITNTRQQLLQTI